MVRPTGVVVGGGDTGASMIYGYITLEVFRVISWDYVQKSLLLIIHRQLQTIGPTWLGP